MFQLLHCPLKLFRPLLIKLFFITADIFEKNWGIEVLMEISVYFSNYCYTKVSLIDLRKFKISVFSPFTTEEKGLNTWDSHARNSLRYLKRRLIIPSSFLFFGANMFKSLREIVWNNSNWLASIFFSRSFLTSSARNSWLEMFLQSRYISFLGLEFLIWDFEACRFLLRF